MVLSMERHLPSRLLFVQALLFLGGLISFSYLLLSTRLSLLQYFKLRLTLTPRFALVVDAKALVMWNVLKISIVICIVTRCGV